MARQSVSPGAATKFRRAGGSARARGIVGRVRRWWRGHSRQWGCRLLGHAKGAAMGSPPSWRAGRVLGSLPALVLSIFNDLAFFWGGKVGSLGSPTAL